MEQDKRIEIVEPKLDVEDEPDSAEGSSNAVGVDKEAPSEQDSENESELLDNDNEGEEPSDLHFWMSSSGEDSDNGDGKESKKKATTTDKQPVGDDDDDSEPDLEPKKKKRFLCNVCGSSLSSKLAMKNHQAIIHNMGPIRFACEVCGKPCPDNSTLVIHRRIHTQEKPFGCPHCPYACGHKGALKEHVAAVHGDAPDQFTCETCGKKCTSSCRLVAHQLSHSQEKPFKCQHCSYSARQKGSLKTHLEFVHSSAPGRFTCDICGKRCASNSNLITHVRVHTKEKPFECELCEYTCNKKKSLSIHLHLTHGIGENRFSCDVCGRRCASKSSLTIHLRTHSQEKPFKCSHCSYAAARKDSLDQHVDLVHCETPSRFTCTTCGQRCASKSGLRAHQQIHNKEKPFKCPHCPHSTIRADSLRRHFVSWHAAAAGLPVKPTLRRGRKKKGEIGNPMVD